jgi:hypothetical protein
MNDMEQHQSNKRQLMESEIEELKNEIHSLKMKIADMESAMTKLKEDSYNQGYEDGWDDYLASSQFKL